MSRIAYVDWQYVPHRSASVCIEDRGYQFADGVYDVLAVVGGHLLDEASHQLANEAGTYEAWLIDREGRVTEGTSTAIGIDGDPVGSAVPCPLSRRLRDCYLAHAVAAEGPP